MKVLSYVPLGYEGITVSVEVDIRRGIPGTEIVGMPGTAVREARERVRVALKNSGFTYPRDRILVNLSPADLPKLGSGFDLAIAVAVLSSSGQLTGQDFDVLLAVGELGLDGSIRRVPGVIAAVAAAKDAGIRRVLVPEANLTEAIPLFREGLVSGGTLKEAVARLQSAHSRIDYPPRRELQPPPVPALRFEFLRQNQRALRAAIIAASGRHNLLLVGPPGSGKTVLARSLPALLPPLTWSQSLEVTRIHSQAGVLPPDTSLITRPPFRSPHHTASTQGIVGGGSKLLPGEISLAHHGILFLDEALEFRKNVLQSLREPMERRRVYLARAGRTFWFPAHFQLIMASNACPCGNLGKSATHCSCSFEEVSRYWRRLGGPLLDRMPLRVPFGIDDAGEAFENPESIEEARRSIVAARAAGELRRRKGNPTDLSLSAGCGKILRRASDYFALSRRGQAGALSVARTIADLEGSDDLGEGHLLEAIAHRSFLEGTDNHPALSW